MAEGRVIIIGAGLTGLCAAVVLKRSGVPVTLLEAGARAGGAVASERDAGFLVEHGPNSMMVGEPAVGEFLASAGLDGEIIQPRVQKRFLVREGKALALPSGPAGALTTPLFSATGKLRVLAEPFVPRARGEDESLAALVRRRLGPEILTYAVEPFVAGIYAGDPDRLSARHAFPKLWNLEKEHGSFIRGALRLRRSGAPPRMISFREGMGGLPDRLAMLLGQDLRCHARVGSIAQSGSGWSLVWDEQGEERRADGRTLVCAVPAFAAPRLPWPEGLRQQLSVLDHVVYPPVSIAALGFPRSAVAHPLDGFGILVPAAENRRILGVIFSSSLFPGRAPEGQVLLTAFVGGARQPELALLEDAKLESLVRDDLAALLGVEGAPVFRRIIRWPRAIPQYNLGHGEIINKLEKLEAGHPGLHFVGNYRGGIAAGQCIRNGLRLAEQINARNT